MLQRHYRNPQVETTDKCLISPARDTILLDRMPVQLAGTERACPVLHAKSYGASGMTTIYTTAQKPEAKC